DGGSIDGTVIGAATQAAGDFTAIGAVAPGTIVGTTITANTSLLPDAVGGADLGSASAEWGDAYIADDKKIKFGSGQNATIEYDADGSTELRFAGAAAIFEEDVTLSGDLVIEGADGALKLKKSGDQIGSATALAIGPSGESNQHNVGFYWNLTPANGELVLASNNENQFIFSDGFMKPANSGDIELGGSSKKFSDGYFSGTLLADKIKLDDDNNSNYTIIEAADETTADITYKLPADKGSAGQVLEIFEVNGSVVDLVWGADGRPEAPPTPNSSSDRRFKKNISTVSGALQKLSKLNPVNYDWRQDEFEDRGFNDKKQWGFIAQEIKDILPELVGKDDEDFLTLNYQGFVPLLTKAVQEQQEEIDSQQKEIDALKSQLQMIMDMLDNDMSDKTDNKKDNDNKKPVKLSMVTQ
ncbi:MAG: tail fiber domain-containing protein, partial [Candidatus Neomarinimicrobiota bacterium]|nr:tail fiber domain-containing protein [Candidatus Neomarinimicrobiota bacterium]